MTPVLACQDRMLRVLRDSSVMQQVELSGPPSALHLFYNDGGEYGDEVLYGTADGKVGLVRLARAGAQHHWLLRNDNSSGAVQTIDNYDITGDGVKDLIIGRHDGSIEVYTFEDGEEEEPTLRFTHVNIAYKA